ncbi:MAG: WcaF family extracellular polysaccharide biosynthesis acetyltransferase [Marinilabiliaceae bacterium]|nr:WcaF family extracellular polysaccharide biosynthesis acetyltransferase [Marinilabiliaceae bacterium]
MQTDLSKYNNSWYKPGGNSIKQFCWYFTNSFFFMSSFFPISTLKVFLLKLFGAKIGKGVVIKPSVNIKYPWNLTIGNYTWIGENVWIDNLDKVTIGNNCCISQGAFLLCGNHNYKKKTFDLLISPIIIEDGVWIGAKAIITGGITCHSHSVLSAGSITSEDLEEYSIYKSHQLVEIRKRNMLDV